MEPNRTDDALLLRKDLHVLREDLYAFEAPFTRKLVILAAAVIAANAALLLGHVRLPGAQS